MLRRLLPTLILLGAGFAALTWGLVRLAGIFEAERAGAQAAAEMERTALQEYASRALVERLRARLRSAAHDVAEAAADPLRPNDHLLLVRGGRQLLPVTARPAAPPPEAPGDEVPQRRELTDRFLAALAADDPAAQARAMRKLLVHRALFVLSPEREVVGAVELLEAFTERGRPHAALMQGLLREGVEGAGAERVEGLQRLLLRARPGMPAADAEELGRRVAALCRAHRVPVSDFEEAMERPLGAAIALGAAPAVETYLRDGAWLVGPGGSGEVIGMTQPLEAPVAVITAEMVGRGLLQPGERLVTPALAGRSPVADLSLALEGPRVQRAYAAAQDAYVAKRGLLGLCWLFGLVIVGLAVLAQARKVRFVQLKEDFVSMVSHELRTPLASIRVMAETLGRKLKGQPDARDYPERIVRAADRLHGLVENVLTFERAERGRLSPRREDVRLGEAVDRASEGVPAAVNKAPGVDEVVLNADFELLTLLLSNLANNACRHSGRGDGVHIQVEASLAAEGGEAVVVRLSDNGRGIAARDHERVFEEFRRGPSDKGGTGLGLAICRRIMRAHGGEIRIAESGPDGTTFEMRFPAA